MLDKNKIAKINKVEGDKVFLLPVETSMAEEIFEANEESQKELLTYMPWENKTLDDVKIFIDRSMEQREKGTDLNFTIYAKKNKRLLGVIGVMAGDPFTPKAEIGYWMRTSAAGNGYMSDSLNTILKLCRDTLALKRVSALVSTTNPASQKVAQNCGLVKEGCMKKAELCHGTWHDLNIYAITYD